MGSKEMNVRAKAKGQYWRGDFWTCTAADHETKMVPCWHVRFRNAVDAERFIGNLADRIFGTPQISTDGLRVYVSANRPLTIWSTTPSS